MIWKVMHISAIMKFFFSQYYKMVHYVVNNHLINKGISDDAGDKKMTTFWKFKHNVAQSFKPKHLSIS